MTFTDTQRQVHARAWQVAYDACNRHHAMQRQDELTGALGYVLATVGEPDVIVEIGSAAGGTLYAWRAMFPDARVLSVTGDHPQYGERREWGATVIVGDSHDRVTLQRLKDQLGGRKADVLFIDGDHTPAGVQSDWEMYAPLVRAGGLVLFHDIAHPAEPGVGPFWERLAREAAECGETVTEIVSKSHPAGFGIVRMAGER